MIPLCQKNELSALGFCFKIFILLRIAFQATNNGEKVVSYLTYFIDYRHFFPTLKYVFTRKYLRWK